MANKFFTTPVARIVDGSLYKAQDKDADGKPLVVKSGPNAGQPRVTYYFGLAIPKGRETHWAQTEWGALIYSEGSTAFPQAHLAPSFAWKVTDGDSTIPNKKGKRPCDREGFPGHWVLHYASSYAPKVYGDGGATLFLEVDRVKPGHYVQVYGSVGGNGSQQNPGIFLNHSMVCFVDFGQEIVVGADPTSVGFTAQRAPSAPGAAPAFGAPHAPVAPPAVPVHTAPPAVPVVPNPAILAIPPAVPNVPPVPVAPPAKVLTPAGTAAGTYESFIAAGWTDAQMVQHGYLAA